MACYTERSSQALKTDALLPEDSSVGIPISPHEEGNRNLHLARYTKNVGAGRPTESRACGGN